jgi:GTPase SAR1 family protein
VKIVVKGDRNTGKSCLMKMLQGEAFNPNYTATPQIEVSWIPTAAAA